jgi:hypothetical protein
MMAEAMAEIRTAIKLSAGSPFSIAALGHLYATSGNMDEAHKLIGELQKLSKQRYVSPFCIATIYAGLGEEHQALDWLERACEQRSGWLIWLKADPYCDPLRFNPRFAQLLRRMRMQP